MVHVRTYRTTDAMQYWTVPYAYGKVPIVYAYGKSLSCPAIRIYIILERAVARNSTTRGSHSIPKLHLDLLSKVIAKPAAFPLVARPGLLLLLI